MSEEMKTDLVRRMTVEELVAVYKKAKDEIVKGFAILDNVQEDVIRAGCTYFSIRPDGHYSLKVDEGHKNVFTHLKTSIWQIVIDKLNVRNVMCTEARNKLDKQMQTGEGLPEIETEAILDVIKGMMGNIHLYAQDACLEAFTLMRRRSDGYKSTDEMFKIGEKVVLGWTVDKKFDGRFDIRYGGSRDELCTIENAFRMLDGKGPGPNYASDLQTAIRDSENGEGETEYFRFRAFKNMNLHVWFKRLDLVSRLNELGGGAKELDKA